MAEELKETGTGGGEGGDKPFLGTYKTQEEAEAGFKEKDSKISEQGKRLAELEAKTAEQGGALELLNRLIAEAKEEPPGGDRTGKELTAKELAELKEEDPGTYADYKIAQGQKELHQKLAEVTAGTRRLETTLTMAKHEKEVEEGGLLPYIAKLQQMHPGFKGVPGAYSLFVQAAKSLKAADDGAKLSLEKEELEKQEKQKLEAEKLAAAGLGEKAGTGGEGIDARTTKAGQTLLKKADGYSGKGQF